MGVQTGTLYRLSIDHVPPSSSEKDNTTSTSEIEHITSTTLITTTHSDNDLTLWHNRMGHVNPQVIKKMSTHHSLHDFTIQSAGSLPSVCRGCALGKQHKASYAVDVSKERSKVPGELLHADICGKMSRPSLGSTYYYFLIKDDCTSYKFIAFLKTKGEAIRFFLKVLRSIERTTGNRTKTLRTDRGGEFCNEEFDLLLEQEGVERETIMPHTPQQNGYVEWDNRTIYEAARSMLHLHDLPLKLWAEAVHTAVYLLNRTITKQVGYTTPFELWFKTKPIVSHYKTFGTMAYIFIDKSLRTKFQSKETQVIFVGYSATSKGWRFWNPLTDRVSESSDVIFDEATGYSPSFFPSKHPLSVSIPTHLPVNTPLPPHQPVPISTLLPSSDSVGVLISSDSIPSVDDDFLDSQDHLPAPLSEPTTETIHTATDLPSSSTPAPPPSFDEPAHPKFRSLHDVYFATSPIESVAFYFFTSYANMIHAAESYREPPTYKQATMSPQAAYWKTTMEKEYDLLMDNHTWILVPPPPWSKHHSMQMGLPHQIHLHWHPRQVQSSPCRQWL